MTDPRQIAFNILTRHPDCIRDDVSLNDLIEDIAAAITEARGAALPPHEPSGAAG